jgi:hypothetical protein
VVKACARCSVSGLEQSTGKQGKEPLKTLATYRCWEQAIWFGQNLVARGEGVLNVGAAVEIISCDLDKVYTVLHICHRQKETSYRRFPHLAPHSSALYFEHHDAVISSVHSHLQEIQKPCPNMFFMMTDQHRSDLLRYAGTDLVPTSFDRSIIEH